MDVGINYRQYEINQESNFTRLFAGGTIGYRHNVYWYKEWCDLEKLEVQNRHIDTFRQESHEIFVLLIELSLSGETVLEWEYADWNITIINAW